jgi:hypothetical protein
MSIEARYDDKQVTLSKQYLKALHDLMRAELVMMRAAYKENAHCWTWGKCEVGDLSLAACITFEFGGEEDRPDGMVGETMVIVEKPKG